MKQLDDEKIPVLPFKKDVTTLGRSALRLKPSEYIALGIIHRDDQK